MVQLGMAVHLHWRGQAPAFRIAGTKDDPVDAGEADGGCAHRTGLDGDIKRISWQALCADAGAGFTDHLNLGMGGGVAQFQRAVPAAGDDLTADAVNKDGADRYFFAVGSSLRLFQRSGHSVNVCFFAHKDF